MSNGTITITKPGVTVDTGASSATAVIPSNTQAYQTVDVGSDKAGGDSTGLTDTVAATSGYQTVNYTDALVGANPTSLDADTAGYQTVDVGGAKAGGDATGLANDATAYTASISVDGVAKAISVVGSAAQTFTNLLTEINTDLAAAATIAISGGNLKVTSATTGVTSTVAITDTDLFATLTGYVEIPAATAGTTTTYTATITIDGVAKAISVVGEDAQTFTDLISEINTDLGASATASLVSNQIKVTSATTGDSSTVSITDVDLFSSADSLPYVDISTAVDGTDAVVTTYTATVIVDGVVKAISVAGGAAQTFTNLLTEINTDLGATATAAINGGNIRITSATYGSNSSVEIRDTDLFSSLTDYASVQKAVPPVLTKYVRISGLSGGGYVRFGNSAVTASSTGVFVNTTPQVFNVSGHTHFAYIQAASTQKLNVVPVDEC